MRGQRKPRKSGRGAPRANARVARAKASTRSIGRHDYYRDNAVSRAWRDIRGWFTFSRPMLALCASLAAFVVIVALFVGGYIGRSVRGVGRAVDGVIAEAGFGIEDIHIAGNHRTPGATIAAALGLSQGQSIFDADLRAARRRLLALDWISEAEVRRRYPASIEVRVVEKVPYALWRSPAGLYVIDRSGETITAKDVQAFAKFPKLVGEGANKGAEIVDAVAQHRGLVARVSVIERVGNRRWNLHLDDGVTVKLPEKDWQRQLDVLEHLIIDKGVLERDITEIDLRSPTHYFFVTKTAPKKDDGGKQI